jgi:hypothetical protein
MTPERSNRALSDPTTHATATVAAANPTCLTGVCGYGEYCVCWFYLDWTIIWPTPCNEPVSVQLRRRRAASWRCARLDSGHRDPISASRW